MTSPGKRYPKTCEYCGKAFNAYREAVRFCGTLCGARGQNRTARTARVTQAMTKTMPTITETVRPLDKSKEVFCAQRLLKAVEEGLLDLNRVSKEMRQHINQAKSLVP